MAPDRGSLNEEIIFQVSSHKYYVSGRKGRFLASFEISIPAFSWNNPLATHRAVASPPINMEPDIRGPFKRKIVQSKSPGSMLIGGRVREMY